MFLQEDRRQKQKKGHSKGGAGPGVTQGEAAEDLKPPKPEEAKNGFPYSCGGSEVLLPS